MLYRRKGNSAEASAEPEKSNLPAFSFQPQRIATGAQTMLTGSLVCVP